LRELQRKSGLAVGTIQKEIGHLKKMDLIISKKDGNRVNFTANKAHPLYRDICNLVEKTTGVLEKLKTVLLTLSGIECAFVFGSFAKGTEKSHSDIDLIIIGSIGLRTLSSKLKEISDQAEREINPHVYTLEAWKKKIKSKEHFITTVLNEEKKILVGDADVLK
jgi:predicted nucleotidyltransferase